MSDARQARFWDNSPIPRTRASAWRMPPFSHEESR
jgi:hypothetical protein